MLHIPIQDFFQLLACHGTMNLSQKLFLLIQLFLAVNLFLEVHPAKWNSNNALEECKSFFLNKYLKIQTFFDLEQHLHV